MMGAITVVVPKVEVYATRRLALTCVCTSIGVGLWDTRKLEVRSG